MSVEIDTRITPALDPEIYRAVPGYNDDTRGYVDDVVGAFNDIYVTLGRVHDARVHAERNPAWTPENRILIVGREAQKQKERVSRRLDRACEDLKKRIDHVEGELSRPLTERAALGTINAEVREYARGLDREGRAKLLSDAMAADDEPTLTAILGAQPFLSGLSHVDRDHYVRIYHEKKNPQLVARLDVMKAMAELAGRNSGLIHAQFEKAIGAKPHVVSNLAAADERARAALKIEPA